jgi:CheY-like chemotaxis protein
LDIAQRHAGSLDVPLTDIVMPGLRGTELARPRLRDIPSFE